ncbi:MAG: dimethyladenosine transferase [Deltaproteobacteria bacterium]|nr:dimethyladenosine transferase [Deltaproteobacteria bacterium]
MRSPHDDSHHRPRTLGAILFEGFELLDLYGPLEMFGCLGNDLQIETIAERSGPVASSPGPASVAVHSFDDCPDFDLYLIPGGQGVFTQQDNPTLLDFLRRRNERAELIMTVCNGAAIAASAGLLDGRRATTNKIFFDSVESRSDKIDWVHEARWIDAGPIATASGVSAGMDMALAMIARLYGDARAEAVAIVTEYEWHRESDRDPFHTYLNQTQWIAQAVGLTGNDGESPA